MKFKKNNLEKSINKLKNLYKLAIIFWFISIYLMFFTEKFKILGIIYLIIVGAVNLVYSACPLTNLEKKLLKLSGNKSKVENFTPRFFREYFGFEIPYRLTKIIVNLFLILAIFYLIKDFIL